MRDLPRRVSFFAIYDLYNLTLRARERTRILGSISRLARRCHHQRVEVGLSPSVNSGVPAVFKSIPACLKALARMIKVSEGVTSSTALQNGT